MKEIKFRVWDKERKKMIKFRFWSKPTLNREGRMVKVDEIWFSKNRVKSKDGTDYSLMEGILLQFTGLVDENGKEIYEGDIVKDVVHYLSEEVIFVVEWNYSGFRLKCLTEKEYITKGQWIDYPVSGLSPKIIGNIYENKNLIESEVKQ